jgi:Tol biopolymer transport system component
VDVWELYVVDSMNPGVSVKLNPALVPDGDVDEFALSPTGTTVAYIADQETSGRHELYLVDLANPGVSVKVSAPLEFGRDVFAFAFSPDGSRIAYRADQDTDDISELYIVAVAQPGASAKLNATLPPAGEVLAPIVFSPDGTRVAYRADQDTLNEIELFMVDIAVPGVTFQLNSQLTTDGDVTDGISFSPDGTQVAYVADQDVDSTLELYNTLVTQPGTSTKLNGPLVNEGDVCQFEWSPDSSRVVYCGDQDTDGVKELYTVDLGAPGVSVKLNAALPAGGEVTATYDISPDSNFVVYVAEQETDDKKEIFRVDVAAPGLVTKVSAPMIEQGDAWSFRIRSDGTHIAYIADQDQDEVWELYEVDLAALGAATKLSATPVGLGLYDFVYSADDTHVVYHSAQDGEFAELYRVERANPGVSTKLNGALASGGAVWDFRIAD